MTTRIGKDVIESLTNGMYEDSRFIFREYIQNAADQIDAAVELGFLSKQADGNIYITIDKKQREIVIEDDATGIPSEDVIPLLKSVAKSPKDRSKHKGFRGIGRLGGLGYCEQLVFETSAHGETIKSILTWDASKLHSLINNRKNHEDASEVIDAIVDISQVQEESNSRFFRVVLRGVNDDELLDRENVRDYLSMVAPVPYNDVSFRFAKNIRVFAHEHAYRIDEYKVFLNEDQIKKAYTNNLYRGVGEQREKYDEILNIEFFELRDEDNIEGAWGWYGISSFNGIIPAINPARGLRLRKGNIQIGGEDCLEPFHKEKRGNSYYFGEIHALDPNLIPNARRDYFIENPEEKRFASKLRIFLHADLYDFYHLASELRGNFKPIRAVLETKLLFDEKEKKGYKSNEEKSRLQQSFDSQKEKAEKAEKKIKKRAIQFSSGDTTTQRVIQAVLNKEYAILAESLTGKNQIVSKTVKELQHVLGDGEHRESESTTAIHSLSIDNGKDKPLLITDSLKLNNQQRKLLERVFEIIERALPKDVSHSVIHKIVEEFK